MVKGVLFDFWGTLVENGTYSPLRQSYSILRARMRFGEFAEKFEKVLMTKEFEDQATGFAEVCKTFNVDPKPPIIEKLIGIWNKNRLLADVYPDTIDTLKALKEKGLKIVLVSNAPANSIEQVLDKFEMKEFFDGIFISYQHGKLKTDGLFKIALKGTKLKASDVISIGDSKETDIKGAEGEGIKAYLIDRKDRREFERKIKSLSEILPELEG
jgi:HAD superfamily hydrolase (TIGR01549 family)